jgi:hypothetical protein
VGCTPPTIMINDEQEPSWLWVYIGAMKIGAVFRRLQTTQMIHKPQLLRDCWSVVLRQEVGVIHIAQE